MEGNYEYIERAVADSRQGVTSSLGAGRSKIRRRKRKGYYGMLLRHSDLVESCELGLHKR
jgi:hypothetical protein